MNGLRTELDDPQLERVMATKRKVPATPGPMEQEFQGAEPRGLLPSGADPSIGASAPNKDDLSDDEMAQPEHCLLYTSPSPRDRQKSRMPSSA